MFDFNPYSALLLPAFLQGVLFAFLCLLRYYRERRIPDLFLCLLIFLLNVRLSFWMLGFAGWYDRHNWQTSFMFYFPFNTLIWIGPCLYFYFLSLTNKDFHWKKRYWYHLVLPIALLLLYILKLSGDLLFYSPFPKTVNYQYGTRGVLAEMDKALPVYLISYASLGYYFWRVLQSFDHYRVYLLAQVADTEKLSLRWLQRLIILIAIALLIFLLVFIAGQFTRLNYSFNWYPYLMLGFVIYYVSINGYIYTPSFFRYLEFEIAPVVESKDLPLPELEGWKKQVEDLMLLEKPYLDSEITLHKLGQNLEISQELLSKVINEGFGQNFNDYINGLRSAEVIRKFRDGEHLKFSLIGIAFDCGFNSKTTFNRAFKKATGKTPSEMIDELGGSNHDMNL